jgi:hypothetical protein
MEVNAPYPGIERRKVDQNLSHRVAVHSLASAEIANCTCAEARRRSRLSAERFGVPGR